MRSSAWAGGSTGYPHDKHRGHSQWMTKDPVTATLDMPAEEAAHLMLTNGFRHLPVLDGRSLKGVVSIRDVLASGIRRRRTPE